MSESSTVINMRTRQKKARSKSRASHKAAPAKSDAASAPSPSIEALIDAKIQERFVELERRIERSFGKLESKLDRVLSNRDHPASSGQGLSWMSALSALEKIGPLADARPLIEDLTPLVLDQLEQLGFVAALAQTVGNLVNHVSEDVDEFGYDPEFEATLRPLFEFLFHSWWRVEMSGVEHIPDAGPVLLVSNHSGTLPFDGGMIKFGLQELHPSHRVPRVLMHDMFNSLPVLGPILCKLGCVRACHENGEKLLRRGHATMVFPEGAKGTGKYFKQRYRLERFGRGGFVRLAARTGSPIVPIAVVGAEEIYPIIQNATVVAKLLNLPYFPITPTFPWLGLLGFIPLPSKWYIDVGEPMMFDLSAKQLEDDFLMDHLGHTVRMTIQQMVDDRLQRRRSIWLG